MKVLEGDLLALALQGEFDVIIHGCNCQCQMGKGIALAIKNQFPAAYIADCQTAKGAKSKLGTFSSANIQLTAHKLTIVNAYTQYHWRGTGIKVDYVAVKQVMQSIKQQFSGKRIAYPLIGAGLAGGDWNILSSIIEEALAGEDHTLVKFTS